MKNKKDPKISVVMLNHNGLKYLKKTIHPILKLDYSNYEFIIVDNGSTDGSTAFIKKFKKIKLIENKENLGYSKGKNIGVKNAKGKYILLLDNDILIKDKDVLNELSKKYKRSMGFIQILLLDINQKKTKHYGLYFSIYGVNSHQKSINIKNILKQSKNLIKIPSPTGGCMFFNKNNWNKIGGFDESQKFNIDDIDIGPRAFNLGYKNFLYTKKYFIHLGVKNAKTNKIYAKRFNLIFSGHGRSMIKNYNIKNLLLRFPVFFLFQLSKAIKYSFKRKTFAVFTSFIKSIKLFLKNLPDTLKQRKKIQSERKIKEDLFLKIKTPRF